MAAPPRPPCNGWKRLVIAAQIFSSSAAGAWKGGDWDRADQLQFTQQQCGGDRDDRGWWREVAGDKRGESVASDVQSTQVGKQEATAPDECPGCPHHCAPGWCPALQQRSHRTLGVVIPRAGPGSQAWAGRCSRSAKVSAKVAAKVTRDPDTAARQPPAETTTSSSRGGGRCWGGDT